MESIPVSAALNTDSAGNAWQNVSAAVYRVIGLETGVQGTGFLHKSGWIITAEHVIESNAVEQLRIVLPNGAMLGVTNIVKSDAYDLAILAPTAPAPGTPLPLSTNGLIRIGTQVTTWGFPGGYCGMAPLLCVGYVSGAEVVPTKARVPDVRLVINAAFNSGNSGGPLLTVEDGAVVGVVISKLAPISPEIQSALDALRNQGGGFVGYSQKKVDGAVVQVSEAQVIARVLDYLRNQSQLVIGHATPAGDIAEFLSKNGIEP
jgi:S1-C subfamily serine protease